jgi:signal peptidase II
VNATVDKVGRTGLTWLWLSAAIVALDQFTKILVVQRFELYERLELLPVLGLTRLHNTGAAFSFLADSGGWQRWFFIVLGLSISVLIVVWLKRIPAIGRSWLAGSLALVLGGAIGNIIDRMVHGYVVDFVSVHYERWFFPAFNVADSAITVGAIILLIESIVAGDGRIPSRKHERIEP